MNPDTHALSEFDALSRLKDFGFSPRTVYDVGASDGCWSYQCHHHFPEAQCVLFEPLASQSPRYEKGLSDLLSQHPEFILRPHALGKVSGQITISMSPGEVSSTTLTDMTGVEGVVHLETGIYTIDDLIQNHGLPIPQLIKIDTQGSELAILQGAATYLNQVEVLVLEAWLLRGYGATTPLFHELVSYLLPFGFHLWDLGGCYRNEKGVLVSQDMLFVNAEKFYREGADWIHSWDYPNLQRGN